MHTIDDSVELFSIRSVRFWLLFNFFYLAEMLLDSYNLTIKSRTYGFLKKVVFLDLIRVHRITPYIIGNWAILKIEAERGVALSAPSHRSKKYTYSSELVSLWLPFIFKRDEAVAFATTVQKAIIRRGLVNRQNAM